MEKTCLITHEYVNTIIRERPKDIHKGQCGRVLIVAGSEGMAGAAALTAAGALKSGAGLVKTAVPEELFTILQVLVPQAMCISRRSLCSLRSPEKDGFGIEELNLFDSVAIGPGLGVDEKNYELIKDILNYYKGTVILDADGLNTMCRFDMDLGSLKSRSEAVIITPHPGEGNRLLKALGCDDTVQTLGRKAAAEFLSRETGAVVLLKGAGTLVSSDSEGTYINTTGNPGMAKGGSGDVLTGVIAALSAYGISDFDSAKTGAFIHGMAGDIAAERLGQWGMTSADIEKALPYAFKNIADK